MRATGRNALEAIADARHAILVARQQQAMPMNRGVLTQLVGNVNHHLFALAETQRWGRKLAVYRHRRVGRAGNVHHPVLKHEIEHLRAACLHLRALGPGPRTHRQRRERRAKTEGTAPCQ
jgi:hypothetical protein